MKPIFFALCLLATTYNIKAQSFKAAEVEAVDKQFDEGFLKKDINAVFRNVANSAVFYGTDPTDVWPVAVFRKRVEKDINTNKYNLTTVSRTITPVAGGNAAVVIKQVNWPYFTKVPLREVIVYEKDNGWKLKSFSITLLLPDNIVPQLNQLVNSPTAKK
ncbi:hypothetical protein GCM10023187_47450 [Nibrella viscosa]|uniref:Nuclear transport factor 2 family protein n=1 Tax=Nibrella viscosa TaxID=1084524 RepID=A0ABP8KUM5_9BACT